MTKRDWLSVALKTLGVLLVIIYVWALLTVVPVMLAEGFDDSGWGNVMLAVFSIAAVLFGIAVGFLMAIYGHRLADWLLPGSQTASTNPNSQRALFFVAIKFIGVICVISGILRLLQNIGAVPFMLKFYPNASELATWLSQVVWPVAKLTIGIWLVLGGKLLMRLAFGDASADDDDIQPLSWKPR